MRGSVSTVYLGGLWEEVAGGAVKSYYTLNGTVVALRDSGANAVTYLHGDHLGSISLATNASGQGTPQYFGPWGARRAGGIAQTSLNYTGQRLDGTGLLYYHARYYDPVLGRFVSPDTLVPGVAPSIGGGGGALGRDSGSALRALTGQSTALVRRGPRRESGRRLHCNHRLPIRSSAGCRTCGCSYPTNTGHGLHRHAPCKIRRQSSGVLITLFSVGPPGLAAQLAIGTQRPEPSRACAAQPAPQPTAYALHAAPDIESIL